MTKTYTQCVSGDNLSLENIFGIIIIQLQLKKCGETLNVASNARRLTKTDENWTQDEQTNNMQCSKTNFGLIVWCKA